MVLRWFGMITTNTFATMMVPISEPIWMKAPRPLKILREHEGEDDQEDIADKRERHLVAARAASGRAPHRRAIRTAECRR